MSFENEEELSLFFIQTCNNLFGDENVRAYSGRGMNGEECVGIETSNIIGTIVDIVHDITENEEEIESEMFQQIISRVRCAKSDSLGLNKIVYFPEISFFEIDEHGFDEGEDEDA